MKKNRKISAYNICYLLCWGIIFLPPSVSHLSAMLDKIITCFGFFVFLFLVLIKKISIPKSKEMLLLLVFILWCIGITLIKTPKKVFSLIYTSVFPIIEIYFFIQYSIKTRENESFRLLYCICRFYIVINFLSMLIFKNGIFRSAVGASVSRAQWIFGSKNNVALYMIIFIAIIAWYNYCYDKDYRKFTVYSLMGFFSVAMCGEEGVQLFAGSSTGILAMLVTLALICYTYFTQKTGLFVIGNRTFLIAVGVSYFVILAGGTLPFVQNFIVNVLHKTLTYSGRASIWQTTILNIYNSLWSGHGEVDFYSTVYIDGQLVYTSYTYNAVLKIILNYGVIGLVLLAIFIFSIHSLNEFQCKLLFSGFIGLLIIGMMNELDIKWIIFFPILISCGVNSKINNTKVTVKKKRKFVVKV